MLSTIVFAVPDDVHLLDLAGPAQVFSSAEVGYRLAYVGSGPITSSYQGLTLSTDTTWPELEPSDTVVVPGWRVGTSPLRNRLDPALLHRVAAHHAQGGRVVSVCAGAVALAEAGVLDGRRATTHHDIQAAFARAYPRVEVVRDALFVSDGRVHTSAGVASGIDLALHLVAIDHGPSGAARTAQELVVAARRQGDARQHNALLRHRDHRSDIAHQAQDVIDAQYAAPLALDDLAATVAVSPRTLTRAFVAATGLTPLRYQQQLRLETAQTLLSQRWTREQAARQVGFADARALRRLISNN